MKSLQDYFIQLDEFKDRVALEYGEKQYTYSFINNYSIKIARLLLELKAKPGSVITLFLKDPVYLIATILAVIRNDLVYLPIDVNLPKKKVEDIIKYSHCSYLVTDLSIQLNLCNFKIQKILISNELFNFNTKAGSNLSNIRCTKFLNAGYLIYTSGTTGEPKGVLIRLQKNIFKLLNYSNTILDINCNDIVTFFHTPSFDFSVWEIWLSLFNFTKLIYIPKNIKFKIDDLLYLVYLKKVSFLNFTPTAFKQIVKHGNHLDRLVHVKYILFGGESLTQSMIDYKNIIKFLPNTKIINMYGITEVTIHASYYYFNKEYEYYERSIIGQNFDYYKFLILDDKYNKVIDGKIGELFISGICLAECYYNNPCITAEKFVANPFYVKNDAHDWTRMYKTGDFFRKISHNIYEYVGRKDRQIKFCGYRIELDEIENALFNIAFIKEAAVCYFDNSNTNQQQILAFIVIKDDIYEKNIDMISDKWSKIFDSVYNNDNNEENFSGWIDKKNRKPIAKREMSLWVKETVSEIKLLGGNKLAELGCGNGLLLNLLAPKTKKYLAVDFSKVAINNVYEIINRNNLKNVLVLLEDLKDFDYSKLIRYDVVVLNSVIQYFYSERQLFNILNKILNNINFGSKIFVGDIRNKTLIDMHCLYVENNLNSLNEFNKKYKNFLKNDRELILSPLYFIELQKKIKDIGFLLFFLKKGDYENELSKFRFDVVVIKLLKKSVKAPLLYNFKRYKTNIKDIFKDSKEKVFIIENIPNIKIEHEVNKWRNLKGLKSIKYNTKQLFEELNKSNYQYCFTINLKDKFVLNIVCFKKFEDLIEYNIYDFNLKTDFKECYSNPNIPKEFIEEYTLKKLDSLLPKYMIPAKIFKIDKLPTTQNGKKDYKELEKIYQMKKEKKITNNFDKKNQIRDIICNILQVEELNNKENFFELGGDSIAIMKIIHQIKNNFDIDINFDIFYSTENMSDLLCTLIRRLQ